MTQLMVATYTLGAFPTPLARLHRIERALDLGPLYVKRDDLSGFGLAGNKTRPLQYLIAGALRAGSDVFVTGGRAESNFCAAAAAAARSRASRGSGGAAPRRPLTAGGASSTPRRGYLSASRADRPASSRATIASATFSASTV